jgi:hypothetical protein
LAHEHEHAVDRGNSERVQEHRLQREYEGPEGDEQNDKGDAEHGEDEPRERVVGRGEEVGALGWCAAGDDSRPRREVGRRHQSIAQPVDESPRLGFSVLVTSHHDHPAEAA